LFLAPLNRGGIEYMVTGGLASIVYGHPRLTIDVDVVVRLRTGDAKALAALWPTNEFYCPPIEVIETEGTRDAHGHFNIIHDETAMRADIYVAGVDPLNAWALQRRVIRRIEAIDVQIAPIEYVILNKLLYFRMGGSDRHLRDVARMLEISGSEIDEASLSEWIARLSLSTEYARARQFGLR
jgi:hypothetical protein